MLTDEAIQKFADIVRRAERVGFDTRTSPWPEALAESIRSEREGLPGHPPVGAPSSANHCSSHPPGEGWRAAPSLTISSHDPAAEDASKAFRDGWRAGEKSAQAAAEVYQSDIRRLDRDVSERDAVIEKLQRDNELLRQIVEDRKKLHVCDDFGKARFEGVPLGDGLREAADDARELLGIAAGGEAPSYASTIRQLCGLIRARQRATVAGAELSAHFFATIEKERDALREENDALTMTNREAAEVYAQTVEDLATALGVKLDPCSSGCPGHLPADGVAKLKRLRAETFGLSPSTRSSDEP